MTVNKYYIEEGRIIGSEKNISNENIYELLTEFYSEELALIVLKYVKTIYKFKVYDENIPEVSKMDFVNRVLLLIEDKDKINEKNLVFDENWKKHRNLAMLNANFTKESVEDFSKKYRLNIKDLNYINNIDGGDRIAKIRITNLLEFLKISKDLDDDFLYNMTKVNNNETFDKFVNKTIPLKDEENGIKIIERILNITKNEKQYLASTFSYDELEILKLTEDNKALDLLDLKIFIKTFLSKDIKNKKNYYAAINIANISPVFAIHLSLKEDDMNHKEMIFWNKLLTNKGEEIDYDEMIDVCNYIGLAKLSSKIVNSIERIIPLYPSIGIYSNCFRTYEDLDILIKNIYFGNHINSFNVVNKTIHRSAPGYARAFFRLLEFTSGYIKQSSDLDYDIILDNLDRKTLLTTPLIDYRFRSKECFKVNLSSLMSKEAPKNIKNKFKIVDLGLNETTKIIKNTIFKYPHLQNVFINYNYNGLNSECSPFFPDAKSVHIIEKDNEYKILLINKNNNYYVY